MLQELRGDDAQRRALGAAAREDVRARFSAERMREEIEAVYATTMDPATATAPTSTATTSGSNGWR